MSEIVIFKITGISALLQNNPASMAMSQTEKVGIKKIDSPEEEAAKKVYRDEKGNFYILSDAFRASIIGKGGGASGRRIGKRSAISVCSGAIFSVEPRCILVDPETQKPLKKYEIDTRRVVVMGQGILRSRPMFPKWGTRLPFEIDTDFLTKEIVLELLNIAGKICGVGDYRPQKKGSFGRFKAELE